MQRSILYLVLLVTILSSCVTPKIHNSLIAEHDAAQLSLKSQQKTILKFKSELEELEGKVNSLKTSIDNLRNDSIQNGSALLVLQNKHDILNESYDLLTSKNSRQMNNKAKEIKQLLEQLEEAQSELF